VCDVCRLVDDDEAPKPCRFCAWCKSWLCERCRPDLMRRARAATIQAARNVGRKDKP
jgi:hypothetical protein